MRRPATFSREIVDRIKAQHCETRTTRFREALDEIGQVGAWGLIGVEPGFVPDAYRVDWEYRELVIIEVEDTHHIPAAKMERISWLAFDLDEWHWTLRLQRIDRCSRSELDPWDWWLERLRHESDVDFALSLAALKDVDRLPAAATERTLPFTNAPSERGRDHPNATRNNQPTADIHADSQGNLTWAV